MPTKIVRIAAFGAMLILCGPMLTAMPASAADTVNVSNEGGYTRLLFTFVPAAHATATVNGSVLTISFSRKTTFDASAITPNLTTYVGSGRTDPDGKTFRFALSRAVRIHSSISTNHVAIDLMPQDYSGAPPDLPQPAPVPTAIEISKLPELKVRTGAYQNFTRLVFDWTQNVPYAVFPGASKLGIRFEAQVRPDLSAIEKFTPPWVKNASWRIDGKGTVVEFETDSASGFHDFRDGNRIVVDVLAPKTDADTYRPPGSTKPVPTALNAATAPAKTASAPAAPVGSAAISSAQAAAIAATTQTLSGGPKSPPTPATVPPTTGTEAASTQAPKTDAAPAETTTTTDTTVAAQTETDIASGRLTRRGAVLTFNGAANRGSAVFIRGLTAWIVLQGAPPLDAAKLKSELGDFPIAVDASSADGISVLRITLSHQVQIGAHADGSNLKVVIAPQVIEVPIAIGFARNQDDATHSSLSTLLPGATRTIKAVDPVAGDELILVPSAVGRAMLSAHEFSEFMVLPSASGLVLVPRIDDLSVTIDRTRVTITRTGGLALTPPTMSAEDSPAALSSRKNDSSFIDFANWSRLEGGSFLATERKLRAVIAVSKPEGANRTRLRLAQFYLANKFAAEALGVIDFMQTLNPSLQSDRQLQTMHAVANYMMGRYRDAHNDIAGTAFDADRHAAYWRGLFEAALENWDEARVELDRAEPVIKQYPPEWQARHRIAKAQSALGLGHLEVADAAIARLPDDLPSSIRLEADVLHARLLASENRGREAGAIFDTVAQGGDARVAAEAEYYRIEASLKAGVLSKTAAIPALERLRFRWRGDLLELKTLRTLAQLYFAQKKWRNGLEVLRIAGQNFANEERARKAQDEMREAFATLFIGGKADKIPPVQALSIFYDYIEQTPIGPDGDEMIRRMSERLVNVDLLGPAADLLKYQIDKRLDGVARAQVAARLAMVYLLDRRPQLALDTIRSTQISTVPDDVGHQRLLLEARALSALKQWDNALDLIAVDPSPDTARLRADIYWESGNWAIAGQKIEELLGTRWSDVTILTQDEREEVMRAAVAYSLASDETSVDRLRDHFGPKMKATPDASAFAVVTQRVDTHGIAFRDAAAQIAAIDTLQTFMKTFRKHYPSVPVAVTN